MNFPFPLNSYTYPLLKVETSGLHSYKLKYVCVLLLSLTSLRVRMSFIVVPHIIKNI